jgi:hypothetical protein
VMVVHTNITNNATIIAWFLLAFGGIINAHWIS